MFTCIIRFILGGTLMASIYLISQRSTVLAGTIASLPIFSGFSLIMFIFSKNCNLPRLLDMSRGSVIGMLIGAALYAGLCAVLLLILHITR